MFDSVDDDDCSGGWNPEAKYSSQTTVVERRPRGPSRLPTTSVSVDII